MTRFWSHKTFFVTANSALFFTARMRRKSKSVIIRGGNFVPKIRGFAPPDANNDIASCTSQQKKFF